MKHHGKTFATIVGFPLILLCSSHEAVAQETPAASPEVEQEAIVAVVADEIRTTDATGDGSPYRIRNVSVYGFFWPGDEISGQGLDMVAEHPRSALMRERWLLDQVPDDIPPMLGGDRVDVVYLPACYPDWRAYVPLSSGEDEVTGTWSNERGCGWCSTARAIQASLSRHSPSGPIRSTGRSPIPPFSNLMAHSSK